jgi:hypothetical protein
MGPDPHLKCRSGSRDSKNADPMHIRSKNLAKNERLSAGYILNAERKKIFFGSK